ncbi:Nn.00g014960.m01.CDS01 [Neocucurbitaria sp. VM-36]
MSSEYKNTNPLKVAEQAERDLGSDAAIKGHGGSDSTRESGIDESVTSKFAGSTVEYGSGASGQGNNRDIPLSEGGDLNPKTGQPYKAGDFSRGGVGAPEARDQKYAENHGGEDDVRGNIRN